jgi:dihydroflavonol-4-reductase
MKVAVTGANGHVGANLTRSLLDRGFHVRALIYQGDKSLEGLEIERIRGDLLDPASLSQLCQGVEVVFHLAAKISISGERDLLYKTNVEGTRNILKAAKGAGVRRLIHFSSIHALDNKPYDRPMDESSPLVDQSPFWYEMTKSRGQHLVMESTANGLETISFNPTAILGPFDFKPSRMGLVLMKLYNRSLPALVPGGYDWVDVRDVVQAVIAAADKGIPGTNYILSGSWLSVDGLAKVVEDVSGRRTRHLVIPTWLAKVGVPFLMFYAAVMKEHPLYTNESLDILQMGNRKISHSKATAELGFQSRPIHETVTDTLHWFRDHGYIS